MIDTVNTEIPTHDKHAAYNASDRGRQRNRDKTTERYMSRRFVAWDGEGFTLPDGNHIYALLANSEGDTLCDPAGLATDDIFECLLSRAAKDPRAIHIIYGGGYDANCWLASLPLSDVDGVYDHPSWETGSGYRVQWRRGKYFSVSDGRRSITVYDVMPFFQTTFVKACLAYLGESFPGRALITAQKALRSGFTVDDLETIMVYNRAELDALVMLADELRLRLDRVGLRLSRWDGPGAVAATLLRKQGIHHVITRRIPKDVQIASAYAYAGGRFEIIKCGFVRDTAYQYDLNSAYPHAFRYVPNLSAGRWEYATRPSLNSLPQFSVCHCRYHSGATHSTFDTLAIPSPLFRRHDNGAISYPITTDGWYWLPEVIAASEWVDRCGGRLEISESWSFVPDDDADRPFSFIDGLYAKRRALKKAGDGAHTALKLALNSMYGKTAQQVGARYRRGEWRLPPYHQLEYAGYVTASCRATLLRAALLDIESVIAFETDAIFTSKPLQLPLGSGLGEWEQTEYESLLYAQSGFYFGRQADGYPGLDYGTPVDKTRGVDRDTLTRDAFVALMDSPTNLRRVSATLTRFSGYGIARHTKAEWRRWERTSKTISIEPVTGKRWHLDCDYCGPNGELTLDVWHETFCPFMADVPNHAYPIAWLNPDPNMTQLEELRESNSEELADYYD